MIVTQGSVAESNITERHAFSIKANAKAFKLLSSNLYSDKPLAIVRELGCNALDSHVAAGKADVPFKIVLPSDMHPWLEIIDYGTGLNDDQVKNIFTTYFESTKTTSNDYIGAMGLGSKSPFAYTDAFEVFARQGGIQNVYTCFLNKSGAPEIFLMETTKADEKGVTYEDGVTIKVPVKANDYHLFRTAAQKAYRFFPVKPIVGANLKGWDWEPTEFGFEGTNFKVLKNIRQCFALMGPVAYPLDLNQFKNDGFMAKHMNNGLGGFVIDFGIGKLDVNAGREGLSYDEDTIANLEAGVKNIRDEMAKRLQDELDAIETKYDAIRFRLKHDASNMFQLTYKGNKLKDFISYDFLNADKTPQWQVKFLTRTRSSERLKDSSRINDIIIDPQQNGRFVLIDEKVRYQMKIKHSSEDMSKTTFIQPVIITSEGKDQFDDLVQKLKEDGVPYKFLSDIKNEIPVVEKDTSEKAKKASVKYTGFYKYAKERGILTVSTHENLNGLDMEVDSLYVKWDTSAKRYEMNGQILSADEVSHVIWDLVNQLIHETGKPLVIVTHKVYDQIPKSWVDISTLMPAKIATAMSKKVFKDSHPNWACTVLEIPKAEYDRIMQDPKINPLFKEFFDAIRGIQFGQTYDYTTAQFIRKVFSLSAATNPFSYILDFKERLFENHFIGQAARRYYADWPQDDFKESLKLFSAMITHGMIDENKLKEILKTK